MVGRLALYGALAVGVALAWRWWVETPAQRQTHGVPFNVPVPFGFSSEDISRVIDREWAALNDTINARAGR